MNFYADSSYIQAKICALYSVLLRRKDYYEIAKSGNFQSIINVNDAEDFHKNYVKIKEKIFENQMRAVVSLTEASEEYRMIFTLFLRYFDTLNLKLLCAKHFGRNPAPAIWYNTAHFSAVDKALFDDEAESADITASINRTWMKDIIDFDTAASFEDAELMIDRAVMKIATQLPYKMNYNNRESLLKTVSGIIAYFELSWSFRLELIYSWDPGIIKEYIKSNILLPETGSDFQLQISKWKIILLKQIQKEIGSVTARDAAVLIRAEKNMEQALLYDVNRTFHRNLNSVNTVICYLIRLYRQIKNLFSIVEGLGFGLEPDIIMENIICEE